MSGRDERPTFKITEQKFYEICPNCHAGSRYQFRNNAGNGWYGRVGNLEWYRGEVQANLRDRRTTAKSIGSKILKCSNCMEIIPLNTKIGKMLLEIFRDLRAEKSVIWNRQLERLRAKEPVKVWWKFV